MQGFNSAGVRGTVSVGSSTETPRRPLLDRILDGIGRGMLAFGTIGYSEFLTFGDNEGTPVEHWQPGILAANQEPHRSDQITGARQPPDPQGAAKP